VQEAGGTGSKASADDHWSGSGLRDASLTEPLSGQADATPPVCFSRLSMSYFAPELGRLAQR
jgi:hypothetical protein